MDQMREYTKVHRLDQLGEELGALPELAPIIDADGERYAVYLAEGRQKDNFIRIRFPAGVDPAKIDDVVNAHVPSNRTETDIAEEQQVLIQGEIRKLAVDSLKARGELPPDYQDTRGV